MIIPIRCMTCGKVIADKWEYYAAEIEKAKNAKKDETAKTAREILDELKLTKQCCRRHMLGHRELIETI